MKKPIHIVAIVIAVISLIGMIIWLTKGYNHEPETTETVIFKDSLNQFKIVIKETGDSVVFHENLHNQAKSKYDDTRSKIESGDSAYIIRRDSFLTVLRQRAKQNR